MGIHTGLMLALTTMAMADSGDKESNTSDAVSSEKPTDHHADEEGLSLIDTLTAGNYFGPARFHDPDTRTAGNGFAVK